MNLNREIKVINISWKFTELKSTVYKMTNLLDYFTIRLNIIKQAESDHEDRSIEMIMHKKTHTHKWENKRFRKQNNNKTQPQPPLGTVVHSCDLTPRKLIQEGNELEVTGGYRVSWKPA